MRLHRLVELQAHTPIRKLTDTQEEYEFIESLIESQKPPALATKHHYLIKTPFRYPLPVLPQYSGRFKPPFYHRHCFYACEAYRTSAYEFAYHWMVQRVHLENLSHEPQPRTHFSLRFKNPHCWDLRNHPQIKKIMDRKDYRFSHKIIEDHPEASSLMYPSCRDPEKGACVVTFEISTLGKQPLRERTLHFIYLAAQKKCWIEDPMLKDELLEIAWEEVC